MRDVTHVQVIIVYNKDSEDTSTSYRRAYVDTDTLSLRGGYETAVSL